MKKVDQIIASINTLPPYPQVARRAMEAMGDPDCSAGDLVKIIEYDQAITADILRICNSAYFGVRKSISSLRQAITFLGQKNLMMVLLTTSSLKYFKGDTPGYHLKKGELWRHSVACAILCRILAHKTKLKDHQTLFTAGLLHDIGKLILSVFVKEEFQQITALVQRAGYSFLEAEQEVLGLNHAQVGSRIAAQWNFPDTIVESIAMHHQPEASGSPDSIAQVVYLADMGCILMGIGVGADGLMYRAYHQALLGFGLKEQDLEMALCQLHDDLEKAEELIRMA